MQENQQPNLNFEGVNCSPTRHTNKQEKNHKKPQATNQILV